MKKKIFPLILYLFSIILVAGLVSAAVTFTTPASGSTVNGTAYRFIGVTDQVGGNITNFTVWIGSVAVCSQRNVSQSQKTFNCTYDTTGTTDGTGLTFNYSFMNESSGYTSTDSSDSGTQSNDLDNTAPSCTLRMPSDTSGSFEADGSLSFDAIDTALTYSISLKKPNSEFSDNRNVSGANAGAGSIKETFLKEDLVESGTYTVRLTVTDNAGTSTVCSQEIRAGGSSSGQKQQAASGSSGFRTMIIVLGAFLLVIIVVVVAIIASAKAGK